MISKAEIFNLSLGLLLLDRRIANTETDSSREAKILRSHWSFALKATIQDMNLDSTATQADLELIEADPNSQWNYSYKYPTDCVFFRRIQSCAVQDSDETRVPYIVRVKDRQKCLFTNQIEAIGEFISKDTENRLSLLSPMAAMAVAYRLANMSAPLITGKGAATLVKSLQDGYVIAKAEAQEQDRLESFMSDDPQISSNFVRERTS